MTPWPCRAFSLTLCVLLAGCRDRAVEGCLDLVGAERYQEAAAQCGTLYTETGDSRAGAAAARAHYWLGQGDQVLAWAERLAGSEAEAGLWSLAAGIHWQRGETDLAERAFRRDLAAYRAAGDAGVAADCLYGLFFLSWERSEYRKALELALESSEEAAAAGDPARQAKAAEGLFTVLRDVGDRAGARRALELAAGLQESEDPLEQARFLVNEGLLRLDEGRPALARHALERAVALATGSGDSRLLRFAHLDLVQVDLELGDLDRAERSLEAARQNADPQGPRTALLYYQARLERARGRLDEAAKTLALALSESPSPEWAWDLEHQSGLVEEERGDPRAAEAAYERSIRVVEEMRSSLELDELRSWLLDRKREPLESLFLLQARAGRSLDALRTAERAQARTLLDVFLHSVSEPAPAAQEEWSAQQAADRLEALRALVPVMNAAPVAAVWPVERVLDAFGGRHALVYFEAGEEVWRLAVTGGRTHLLPVAATGAEVRGLADRFLARPGDPAVAEELGGLLLPELPPAGTTLYVVADGALGNLPFAALRRKGRYLVEDHPVVSSPSLNALAVLEAARREGYGPSVVLADPRSDLPAAAVEGPEVARRLGGTARVSRQATAGALLAASRAEILHLATHTGSGPRGPWVRLADRDLAAGEIVAGKIGPRLVVLATCASAARPGGEMWGSVGAAFLAAGSRGVLASLWSLDDAAARELVLTFYAEGGAADPAGALARAQRVAIRQGRAPTLWASFVLLGAGPSKDV